MVCLKSISYLFLKKYKCKKNQVCKYLTLQLITFSKTVQKYMKKHGLQLWILKPMECFKKKTDNMISSKYIVKR